MGYLGLEPSKTNYNFSWDDWDNSSNKEEISILGIAYAIAAFTVGLF
jgi:hypothetical protein